MADEKKLKAAIVYFSGSECESDSIECRGCAICHGNTIRAALTASQERERVLKLRVERLVSFHVPPDHECETGTVNPDGDCWICALAPKGESR